MGLLGVVVGHVLFWSTFTWALLRWNARTPHPGALVVVPPTVDYAIVPPALRYDDMLTTDSDWEGLI